MTAGSWASSRNAFGLVQTRLWSISDPEKSRTLVAGNSWSTVIDAQRTEGEPINFIDRTGAYWESGPWGTTTQMSFIHRSVDGGNQFNIVSNNGLRPDTPPGGGDTDVVTDDQGTAYFTDLEALINLDCAVSHDQGNTWTANHACVQNASVDRQWFAVDNGATAAATDNTIFLGTRDELGTFQGMFSLPAVLSIICVSS